MIEVKSDLLISDPIQRPKFRLVSLDYTGVRRLDIEEIKGEIRAVKKYSKLPINWREAFDNLPFGKLIGEPGFRPYVRGLDYVSREDLIFQLFEEVWPQVSGSNRDSGK